MTAIRAEPSFRPRFTPVPLLLFHLKASDTPAFQKMLLAFWRARSKNGYMRFTSISRKRGPDRRIGAQCIGIKCYRWLHIETTHLRKGDSL